MDPHFESIYVNDDQNRSEHKLLDMERLKIGEVFQIRQNHFAFVCVHCAQEFQSFNRFTAHIASHYHNAMHWMTPAGTDDAPQNIHPAAQQTQDESVEWLYSDSSSDSHNRSNESLPPMNSNIECDVQLHEGFANTSAYHSDDGQTLESVFKLKHPLIRVINSDEAKRIQPYFVKKRPFDRTIDQRFKCPMCPYVGATTSTVRDHLFSHSQTKLFACKICDQDFEHPRLLHDHIEQAHDEVAILYPDRQPKRVSVKQLDKQGNVRESNILIAPNIKCEPEMLLASPNGRGEPKLDANGDPIRSYCYLCQKSFARPNGYLKHMKVHTPDKNYQCITCGAQFRRSDHLSRHQLIHEAPKFKCDVCEMSFRRSDKLLEHRRKHPETMNFTCVNCGLGFMEMASIKTHLAFHCKSRIDLEQTGPPGGLGAEASNITTTTTTTTTSLTIQAPNQPQADVLNHELQSMPMEQQTNEHEHSSPHMKIEF